MNTILNNGNSIKNSHIETKNINAMITSDEPDVVGDKNIIVIDSRVLDRECFSSFLKSHAPQFNVTAFGTREDFRASGVSLQSVSVVVLSIGGLKISEPAAGNTIRQAVAEFSPVPVVVLGDSEELTHILYALEYGARGYIPSSVGLAICVEAIKLAIVGGAFIPAMPVMAMRKVIEGSDAGQHFAGMFTPRQADVVMALRRGKANKIIAYELNMRESTVKVHIRNIMKKLRATNRTEVAYKINHLLLPEGHA